MCSGPVAAQLLPVQLPIWSHQADPVPRRSRIPWLPVYHHFVGRQSNSNFSSFFTYCDYIYGTAKVISLCFIISSSKYMCICCAYISITKPLESRPFVFFLDVSGLQVLQGNRSKVTFALLYLGLCLDVVRFISIHMCWDRLWWNLVQVTLRSTPTHVNWCKSDYIQIRPYQVFFITIHMWIISIDTEMLQLQR
jgi:hypothetical protein